MRALIVSDSHGLTKELPMLRERHQDEVDVFIHCGDSELSSGCKELEGFHVVNGNCDFGSSFPNELVIESGSVRFFITHGHLYNVKSTMQNILYRTKEAEAHIACFGHSHIMGAEVADGTLLINPGSILMPRLRKEKTYALLHVQGTTAIVTFLDITGKHVIEQSFTIG